MPNHYPDLEDERVRQELGLPPRGTPEWEQFHAEAWEKARGEPQLQPEADEADEPAEVTSLEEYLGRKPRRIGF